MKYVYINNGDEDGNRRPFECVGARARNIITRFADAATEEEIFNNWIGDTEFAGIPASLEEVVKLVGTRGCVAGGSVAMALLGDFESAGDIDVFCYSHDSFSEIRYLLHAVGFARDPSLEVRNDATDPDDWANIPYAMFIPGTNNLGVRKNIQVCKILYYRCADEVINGFDFTATQFALTGGHYDGELRITFNPDSVKDLQEKKLVPFNIRSFSSLTERVQKYQAKGFTVDGALPSTVAPPPELPKTPVIEAQAYDKWSDPTYRADYATMDPADFRAKYGG